MPKKLSRQADHFDEDPPSDSAPVLQPPQDLPRQTLLRIAVPAVQLTKAQRDFNQLVGRVGALRKTLEQWRDASDRAQRRQAAELVPLHGKLTVRQADTVRWIDQFLCQPPEALPREQRLPKGLRRKLVWMLLTLARAGLAQRPDAELEAAHDRHADRTFADDQREQADLAAAVLGSATGEEHLFEGPAESVEELLARATERMRAARDEAPDEPALRREPSFGQRPGRAEKARLRDQQALKDASQSVRDIYRRLASSLHPDREADPVERERKTALMARVNEAYGRNDLLELMSVQLAIEQIDEAHLRGVSDERLRHYIRVLKEQERGLKDEAQELAWPWQMMAAEMPAAGFRVTPQTLDRLIDLQVKDLKGVLRDLETDLDRLRDHRSRRAFLEALEIYDPDEELDPFEEMLFEQAVRDMMTGTGTAGARAGRGRRRKSRAA